MVESSLLESETFITSPMYSELIEQPATSKAIVLGSLINDFCSVVHVAISCVDPLSA